MSTGPDSRPDVPPRPVGRRTLSGKRLDPMSPKHVPLPSWHELVKQGPKGDPNKAAERAARRAELAGRSIKPPDPPKLQQHGVKSVREGWHGRLVLHGSRSKPASPSGIALASPTSLRGKVQRAES